MQEGKRSPPPSCAPGLHSNIKNLKPILLPSFGLNAGAAVNPARDFSPRLLTLMAGWGDEPFTVGTGSFLARKAIMIS